MSHPNYMDGVPVKISEKYKPPPKVSLPSSIIQRLSNIDSTNRIKNYDFSLETNVLLKINEWKSVREREQNERRERMRLREEEKLRKIEEKQKQMLTDVSYPNAEDLSSSDEEVTIEIKPEENKFSTPSGHFSPPNSFNTILTPTVVPGLEPTTSSSSSSSYRPMSYNYKSVNSNLSKINYSDFENDTSSPFDNMELKTINDLDILAQVLNNSAKITQHSEMNSFETDNNTIKNNLEENNRIIEEENTNQVINKNIENSNNFYNHQPLTNNLDNTVTTTSTLPQYNTLNYNHTNENFSPPQFNYNNHIEHSNIYTDINGYYYNQNYENDYYIRQQHQQQQQQHQQQQQQQQLHQQYKPLSNNYLNNSNIKLKSKSVPDIIKELNDELKHSEMKRTRNNSQSISSPVDEYPNNSAAYLQPNKSKKTSEDGLYYKQLPKKSQIIAKNISKMGFPLNRVTRILQLLGDDDKKIIEHLIPLSELLDLGFDEIKISDALIKFNNNKDKALDYLIL